MTQFYRPRRIAYPAGLAIALLFVLLGLAVQPSQADNGNDIPPNPNSIIVNKVPRPVDDDATFCFKLNDGSPACLGYPEEYPYAFNNVNPGSNELVEIDEPGWNLNGVSCESYTGLSTFDYSTPSGVGINFSENDQVTCIFTNVKENSITIVKDANPADNKEFYFQNSGGAYNKAFSLKDPSDPSKTFFELAPDDYVVAETVPTDWAVTDIVCQSTNGNSTFNEGPNFVTITLAAGDNVTCTFTNEKLGSITIVKDANPADGTAFDFDQDIDASGAFSLTNGESKTFSDVMPAQYNVSETVPSGWYMSLVKCEAASGNEVTTGIDYVNDSFYVTLEPDEDVTCTVSNKLFATLTIKKETVGGDDTFNFTSPFFPVSSFDLTTVGGTAERTFGELPSNVTPYEVNETPQPGWVLTDASCDNGDTPDAVFLAPGDHVTCTFTNEKQAANVCPVDDAHVGNELTHILGIGMGSPTRQRLVSKIIVPNPADVVDLYGQMAAKEYNGVRYVRFYYGSKSTNYVQVQPATSQGAKAAVTWWGADLDETKLSQQPFIRGRFFLNLGMRRMFVPRAFVLYPTYRTAEAYANNWSTFDYPDNFVAGAPGFPNTNTNYLSIPEVQAPTNITVQLAVTDVNGDSRTVDVTVSAGGVSKTVTLTGPDSRKMELLNLVEVTLENVPAGTDQVEIRMDAAPFIGDSAALLGATAHYMCAAAPTQNPYRVPASE